MKKLTGVLAALASAAAITVTGTSSAVNPAFTSNPKASAAVDTNNDDWLHAEGSRLYDMNGNEVWLTGANWFGFNCSENCAHGLYAADVDDFLKGVADHGINVIRFPISSELLVSWMEGSPNDVSSVQASYNPPQDVVGEDGTITPAGKYGDINRDFVLEDGKTLKNSMEIFDIIMQKCKKYGIKAFIDIHSPDANNSGHNYEIWYGLAGVTTDVWIESLVWLADKYKNDDTLIGYDLKNEPHGKRGYTGDSCPDNIAKWDGSTDENNWAYAATKCANAILDVNPNALIFIEGVEQYPKTDKGFTYDTPDIWDAPADKSPWYGAWWGGNLRGVRDFPVIPDSGTSQIVYSPHDYGPSVYAQTWFDKDFTTQTLLDDYWYDTWAYIVEEDIAPLLIGEWGGHMDGGKNQKWMELLRDYMIDHHISHTFWCLNPNSGDTGGLLGVDFKTWDDEKYGLFEPSLWQTQSSGKYIGLDHEVALGVNGISLGDYYANYAASEGSNIDGGSKGDNPGTPATKPTTTPTTKPVTTTTAKPTTAPTKPVTTTTVKPVTPTTPDAPKAELFGDANCDGAVTIADAAAIYQKLANSDKYTLSEKGTANADCCNPGGGITAADALAIQKLDAKLISALPIEE
jgi:aryl-phospho-beta-D-glucosidase BglC (GH1 family)